MNLQTLIVKEQEIVSLTFCFSFMSQIKSLQYHIQHESITLNEEKQILREIKQLEGTREKVIANAALRAKIQESMGEKEALEDQMKVTYTSILQIALYSSLLI